MPHIHLETTADLEENSKVPDILEALTAELCLHETMSSKAVKAYHSLRSVWQMGDGAPAGFAHCEVAILEGRPIELQQAVAASMYRVMREQFSDSLELGAVNVTLELREMNSKTYMR